MTKRKNAIGISILAFITFKNLFKTSQRIFIFKYVFNRRCVVLDLTNVVK